MLASLIRLVLALTLAFNGISAPMAMAHGGHGTQPGHHAQAADGSQAGHPAGHVSPAHDVPHSGHGVPADESPPLDPQAMAGCCDGPDCRCGCILPPAMPLSNVLAVRHELPELAPAKNVGRAPTIALAAPFRPPAA